MKHHILALGMAALLTPAALSALDTKLTDRIDEAAAVLRELQETPDKAIPRDLWTKAECVAVIPGVKRAAFFVGGEYGKGLVSCRRAATWSAPAFLLLGKGSVGFQIGAESIDLVLLVMNERGMGRLLESNVVLGGEASVAAGPVGRNTRAMTDAQLKAEILSYSRAQGLFAGVNLAGGVLKPDDDDNQALYGRRISPREILLEGTVDAVDATAPFVRELQRAFAAAID